VREFPFCQRQRRSDDVDGIPTGAFRDSSRMSFKVSIASIPCRVFNWVSQRPKSACSLPQKSSPQRECMLSELRQLFRCSMSRFRRRNFAGRIVLLTISVQTPRDKPDAHRQSHRQFLTSSPRSFGFQQSCPSASTFPEPPPATPPPEPLAGVVTVIGPFDNGILFARFWLCRLWVSCLSRKEYLEFRYRQ